MAEIDTKGRMTRTEVADFLREFADELDDRTTGTGVRDDPSDVVARDDTTRAEIRDRDERTDRGEGATAQYDDADVETTGRKRGEDTDTHGDREMVDAERVTLVIGGDSATVTVPEMVEFDIEVSSRSPMFSSGVNQEIEFDLSWEIENLEERERSIDVV